MAGAPMLCPVTQLVNQARVARTPTTPGYDAFISYSHTVDATVAPALQAPLQ
jgi:hypothetical protein